jgi:hypothetical protein
LFSTRRKLVNKPFVVFLIVQLLCAYGFTLHSVGAQSDQTASKLQAAEIEVDRAFEAVSAAEKAGANVTSLLDQLNNVTDLLTQAEIAYRADNPSPVASRADNVTLMVQPIISAAQAAQLRAFVDRQDAFGSTISFSLAGSAVLVLALFFVWQRLKSSYVKNLVDLKPEVTSSEA